MIRIFCDGCAAEINAAIQQASHIQVAELVKEGKVLSAPFGEWPVFCTRCRESAVDFWTGPWNEAVAEIVEQGRKRLSKLARQKLRRLEAVKN